MHETTAETLESILAQGRARGKLWGVCWWSLSTKYNHQINKEKDPNAINTQTSGFIWQNSISFGVCLFLQEVVRKYGEKAHMSGLHRDINVCANFLSSRRVQKPRKQTGGRVGPGTGPLPSLLGHSPCSGSQSGSASWIMLHQPKGLRKTMRLRSVWSDSPRSFGKAI